MKKIGIHIPIIWGVCTLIWGVLLWWDFRNAAIRGDWLGMEDSAIMHGGCLVLCLVNAVLWFIRYRRSKQQDETEE
jgi:hypothetical protein